MFFKRNEGRGLSSITKPLFVLGVFCFLLSGYAAAQHTISGRITEGGSALASVTLTGLPNSPILTDGTGFYTDTVPDGWSGTVIPDLTGFKFTPGSTDYINVTADYLNQDYTASVTVQFTASASSGDEGDTLVFLEISLSAESGKEVTVNYTVSGGTAFLGPDFIIASPPVTIPAGDTTTNIVLNIVDDTLEEPNETIILTLTDVTNAVLGANTQHTYTINDNDAVPTVDFAAVSSSGGEESSPVNLGLTLSIVSGQDVTVQYSVTGGTAFLGPDFIIAPPPVTIPAGDTTTNIVLNIVDDILDEPNETIILTLTDVTNAVLGANTQHTYTINDNDAAPTVSFTGEPYTHSETGSQTVTVTLSAESGRTVRVDYAISDGTATAGEDYTEVSGQLAWDPGQAGDKTFSITILEDLRAEDDETVNITLLNGSNCTIDPPNPTTLTITDDDDLNFETDFDEVLIPEGGTAIFSVRLTAEPLSNVDVLVSRLSGDSDITVQSGSNLLFTPVNWDQYQEVTLAAAEDPDIDDGQATIRINAAGIPALDITATEQDNAMLNGEIALVLSSAEGTSGNHFDTNIAIFNNKQQVSSFDLGFHFDDSMFTFVGSESGTLTSNWSVLTANEVSAGNIEIHGISGGGTPIPASSQGSVIKIMLQIKCLNLPNDTNTQLRADNYQNGILEYIPDPCIEVFTFKPCTILGDVDANGNVTPGDAQMAFEIFLGRITPDMCQEMTSDADCSSVTTPGDSQQIFEHFLGRRVLPTCCAEEAPLFTAMSRNLERPDLEKEEERNRREDNPSSHLLYPLKIVGLSEEIISVPVILTNPAGIRSFGFELSYPSGLLEYLGTKQSTLTADFSYVEGIELAEGLIRVEGEGEMSIQSNDTGSLAILLFKVNNGADMSLPITILSAYGDILHAKLIEGSITRLDKEWEISRFLNLGNARQKSDGTVRVPLRVNTGFLLKAFGLVMQYSTENLTFVGIERGKLTKDFVSLDGAEVKPGKLKVGGFAMSEILELEPGTLFYLVFSKHGVGGEVEILRLMDDLHHYVIQNGQTKIQ